MQGPLALRPPFVFVLAAAVVLSSALSGCLGGTQPPPPAANPPANGNATVPPPAVPPNNTTVPPISWPRDYLLAHDEWVNGSGYAWMDLAREGRTGTLEDADISADGSLVALGFEYGDAEVWTTNGTLVAALAIKGSDPANCDQSRGTVRFVGNDRLLVLFNQCVKIFDFDGNVVFELAKNNAVVWYPDVLISEDGRRIAALDNYSTVLVVDLGSGARFTVPITYSAISEFALSPDGRVLITVDGATRFWRLDDGVANGTLIASFERGGRVVFSDDPRYVFQDTSLSYPAGQVHALERYTVNGSTVTNESWSCDQAVSGAPWPLCPPYDSRFDAAGAGNRVAWVGHLKARWQDEDSAGHVWSNETYGYTVTLFDWGAPNGTRGFQVGPSRTYAVPPSPERDWNHDAVVRAFVMPDGSAFAVSKIGGYGRDVQLTRAAADAVLPTVIRHDY